MKSVAVALQWKFLRKRGWAFMAMTRINVGLPPTVIEIIKKELKGKLGFGDSEIIRNIVMIYLSERGYFKEFLAGGESEKEPRTR